MSNVKFVSAREAGELLGIEKSRVTRLAAQGRIDGAQKIGGAGWIIPLGEDGRPTVKTIAAPVSGRSGRPPKWAGTKD